MNDSADLEAVSVSDDPYPAIMVTDTALFRYPHHHLPSDTPDKVDYERLAWITNASCLRLRLELALLDWRVPDDAVIDRTCFF